MPKPNRPVLQVPQAEARKAIEEQVDQGRKVLASIDLGFPSDLDSKFSRAEKDREKWAKFTIQFLENLFSDDSVAGEFGGWWLNYSEYQDDVEQFKDWLSVRLTRLESILERLHLFPTVESIALEAAAKPTSKNAQSPSKDIFIVHGRDEAAKQQVARFIQLLGLNPIILHEQPDKGRTIIEKFEEHSSNVMFAVVLLTPDDTGFSQEAPTDAKPRSRQNVVFELGFFIAKLGRDRVCALRKGEIETPTDYSGVLYKTMDNNGAWKLELAKEIKHAGIEVDLNKAV